MKRLLVSILVGGVLGLAARTAIAAGFQTIASEVQIATRAQPSAADFTTAASVQGLATLEKFNVTACSMEDAGISNVGSLKAWGLDERTGLVTRNKQIDLDMTTQENARCIKFPDQTVGVPTDRFMYASNGLKTMDGGTLTTDAGTQAFIIYYRTWRSTTR